MWLWYIHLKDVFHVMSSKNIFLFGINGLKIMAWRGLTAGHGLWLPFHLILSRVWNFSPYQVNIKAKKNEALKWKSNFCIALKTLFQGNLQGKLVVFFSKILMLHHMGTSLEKFNIKLGVDFYHLSKKIFKTITR